MNLYLFDFHGAYLGYMDGDGEFFDRAGRKWARLGSNRNVYDLDGNLCGHIDPQGNFFTHQAFCRGYLRGWDDERWPSPRETH